MAEMMVSSCGFQVKRKTKIFLSSGFDLKGGMGRMLRKVKPGDSLPVIEKEIDQDRILRWAQISGDFNRLHVDPEFARQTRFGGTIAHGPMSLAFLNELMMECFGMGWARGGKLLDVRFVAPIRQGDRIRIGGTVKQVQGASVECDLVVEKKDGEKAVVGRAIGLLEPEGK
jgi:3-hydroxybutyryl-CoA dehydratase